MLLLVLCVTVSFKTEMCSYFFVFDSRSSPEIELVCSGTFDSPQAVSEMCSLSRFGICISSTCQCPVASVRSLEHVCSDENTTSTRRLHEHRGPHCGVTFLSVWPQLSYLMTVRFQLATLAIEAAICERFVSRGPNRKAATNVSAAEFHGYAEQTFLAVRSKVRGFQ